MLPSSLPALPRDAVRVRVPASSANLGPGFDCLGLALQLHNFVAIHSAGRDEVLAWGEGEAYVPRGPNVEKNIAVLAARSLFDFLKMPREPLRFYLENAIPLSRGLGSSSAARVGALAAANEWARHQRGRSASPQELLVLATELEGHPDNVAAALLGGLTVAGAFSSAANSAQAPSAQAPSAQAPSAQAPSAHGSAQASQVRALRFGVEKFPRLAVFIPDAHLETKTARGVLPDSVERQDAIFNLGATAMLLAALKSQQWDEVRLALDDRLHQPFRAPLIPAFALIAQAMRGRDDCLGVTISGAGPSVLLWLRPEADVPQVLAPVLEAAREHGIQGTVREVEVDHEGCVVLAL